MEGACLPVSAVCEVFSQALHREAWGTPLPLLSCRTVALLFRPAGDFTPRFCRNFTGMSHAGNEPLFSDTQFPKLLIST